MQPVETVIPEFETNPDFHEIRPAAGGPSIRLGKAALRQLSLHIREGANAIRGRGVEVGGLVLGAPIDWNSREVVITAFVPIKIEYRFGPTFRTSRADIEMLREAAESHGGAVGYYRSQLSPEVSFRKEDRRLLTELFQKADCCLIRGVTGCSSSGGTDLSIELYAVRSGSSPVLLERVPSRDIRPGKIPVKSGDEVVPPKPSRKEELRSGASPRPESAPTEESPRPMPPQSPAPHSPATRVAGEHVRREEAKEAPWLHELVTTSFAHADAPSAFVAIGSQKWLVWALAIVLAGLTLTAAAYSLRGRFVPRPNPTSQRDARSLPAREGNSGLGLHLVDQGAQIEVRWDPTSPLVSTAVRGKLLVPEASGLIIDMDAARVRSGLYSYKSPQKSLTFVILMFQPDGSFAEETTTFTREPQPRPGRQPATVAH